MLADYFSFSTSFSSGTRQFTPYRAMIGHQTLEPRGPRGTQIIHLLRLTLLKLFQDPSVECNGKSKIVLIEITEYSEVLYFIRNPSHSHLGNRNGNEICIVEFFLFSQRYDNFV